MVGKYKVYALGTIAFSLLNVAATLYVPVLIGRAVDCLVYKAVGFDFLRKTVCEMGITIAIAALCLWLVTICNNKLTFGIVDDLRNQTFDVIGVATSSILFLTLFHTFFTVLLRVSHAPLKSPLTS